MKLTIFSGCSVLESNFNIETQFSAFKLDMCRRWNETFVSVQWIKPLTGELSEHGWRSRIIGFETEKLFSQQQPEKSTQSMEFAFKQQSFPIVDVHSERVGGKRQPKSSQSFIGGKKKVGTGFASPWELVLASQWESLRSGDTNKSHSHGVLRDFNKLSILPSQKKKFSILPFTSATYTRIRYRCCSPSRSICINLLLTPLTWELRAWRIKGAERVWRKLYEQPLRAVKLFKLPASANES
jgi:hypothetical protein